MAEVQWRDVVESTDGPVEHARILCVRRHWFLLPVAALAHLPDATRTEVSPRSSVDPVPPESP